MTTPERADRIKAFSVEYAELKRYTDIFRFAVEKSGTDIHPAPADAVAAADKLIEAILRQKQVELAQMLYEELIAGEHPY